MYNNHFAVHLKLTQHCKSTLLQYKMKILKRFKLEYDISFAENSVNIINNRWKSRADVSRSIRRIL